MQAETTTSFIYDVSLMTCVETAGGPKAAPSTSKGECGVLPTMSLVNQGESFASPSDVGHDGFGPGDGSQLFGGRDARLPTSTGGLAPPSHELDSGQRKGRR